MGTLLDTTVFIELERAIRRLPAPGAMNEVSGRLEEQLGPTEEVGIAAITASELLHGVHRATPEHRARREAFVEGVLGRVPVVPIRPAGGTRAYASLGRAGVVRDRRGSARPARGGHRHHRRLARRNSQRAALRAHPWVGRSGHHVAN